VLVERGELPFDFATTGEPGEPLGITQNVILAVEAIDQKGRLPARIPRLVEVVESGDDCSERDVFPADHTCISASANEFILPPW